MPTPLPALAFGGDYNPEQWPAETWKHDVELMNQAGVNLVTVGVFSWALLEPRHQEWHFEWLDEVLDTLHRGGIKVDLATATASPPPWLTHAHPEMLPVTADGTTLWPGARQGYCPSSPIYREHALRLTRAMATRYAAHPGLALWHVNNELGNHNAWCYCDVSAAAFRVWLRQRYLDLDALNDAWGTAFWSQHYSDWEQILPPRIAPNFPNPTQQLDFKRFSSDQQLANFIAERDVLHELSPGVPVTTNLMLMGHVQELDYFSWGAELDIVSNDHYLIAADPHAHRELAFSADWTRGVAGGRPWLLMEQSTSAVNWQPRNVAKRPGELARASFQHVARGADAVLFFQWRASRAGAEKFHSALVPHAGTDSRVWREVCELSAALQAVREVAGSGHRHQGAILLDWSARWASELDSHPTNDLGYLDQARGLHRALTDLGVGVDLVHPESDLSGYDLIVVPTLYLVSDAAAQAIADRARQGATVVVTFFSGIVDENDHIRLGGYPGAFTELLGIRTEEFTPLRDGEQVYLDNGMAATVWTEDLALAGAESIARYVDGPVPNRPAITRNRFGSGTAWYLATKLGQADLDTLVGAIVEEARLDRLPGAGAGVEVVRRVGETNSWLFVINHSADDVHVDVEGVELIGAREIQGSLTVPGGAVAVVRER